MPRLASPGVHLASALAHPPTRRGDGSHADKGGFWPVSPGGGRDGAVMLLGGRGTFHSSWAREVFATGPGAHVSLGSLFLAAARGGGGEVVLQDCQTRRCPPRTGRDAGPAETLLRP